LQYEVGCSNKHSSCHPYFVLDFQKKTKIFKIERQSLWAFQLIDKIKAVFSQPGYPKHIRHQGHIFLNRCEDI
jgi:hypothetical protein